MTSRPVSRCHSPLSGIDYIANSPLAFQLYKLGEKYGYNLALFTEPPDDPDLIGDLRATSMQMQQKLWNGDESLKLQPHRSTVTLGGFGVSSGTDLNSTLAGDVIFFYDSSFRNALPALAALLAEATIRAVDTSLAEIGSFWTRKVSVLPVYTPPSDQSHNGAVMSLPPMVLQFALLPFTLLPVIQIVHEREAKVKHQLCLMGLDVRVYWAVKLLYQSGVLLTLFLAPTLVSALVTGTVSGEGVAAFALIAVCALPSILLFAFLISFVFKTKEAASGFYLLAFTFTTIVPTIVVQSVTDLNIVKGMSYAMMLIPINQIIKGLSVILYADFLKKQQEAFAHSGLPPAFKPPDPPPYLCWTYKQQSTGPDGDVTTLEMPGPGFCLLAAFCTFILYSICLYYLDVRLHLYPGGTNHGVTPPPTSIEDEDVAAERARAEAAGPSTDWVRAVGLRRVFYPSFLSRCKKCGRGATNAPKAAVENLSFGIAPGTCFALLGPNGAGKTTSIGMLTGETWPTAGDGTICDLSVRTQLQKIYKRTGFCPQFEGLSRSLTLRQHLELFMRLKGTPAEHARTAAMRVEAQYGLEEHAMKLPPKLSGGTRRKLSAAIAMSCGRPDVVFLDEPTTGVDVGTRKFIWSQIQKSIGGRVILLTTHYMDEADALAHRIGIMANGRLRVLGSAQHLKSRHGGAAVSSSRALLRVLTRWRR